MKPDVELEVVGKAIQVLLEQPTSQSTNPTRIQSSEWHDQATTLDGRMEENEEAEFIGLH